ncbi:acyl-CoA dehydrogenase family protein [Niveispirillum fermenti]|uniref:acyl-CoA dehydrogenase family protein n=1 Tax=Niveispirillum fermenti TaxID=1233113 RepID=UPI003A8B96AA
MNRISADEGMVAELRDGAVRLVADHGDHQRTRRLRRTLPGYDAHLAGTFAELGWYGVLVPEADGGIGLGLAEMAGLLRELEKGLMAEPLLSRAVLAARVLVHAPAGPARAALLEGLVSGAVRPALALDFDAGLPVVTAADEGEGFRLTGRALSVAGAAGATHLLVPARLDKGHGLFVLPVEAAGVALSWHWRADDSPLGQVVLADVAVPDDALLVPPRAAAAAIARALDETRIVAAAALLGLAEHMLAMTIEYLGIRRQYDQLIGSFQALQHKAVDLYIEKERAVAALGFGLSRAGDPAALPLAALRAKGRCSEAASRIAREAIQLHGAIGFTEEHDLGLYVKRALTLSAWLGDAGEQRRRFVSMGLALA